MGRFLVLPVIAALTVGLAGCGPGPAPILIAVDRPTARVDEPVHLRVTGLRPGARAVVAAETRDWAKRRWRSEATFRADGDGTVEPTRMAPVSGAYEGVDGMGLFAFLAPDSGDADETSFGPSLETGVEEVRISVTVDGAEKATTSVRRVFRAAAVRSRQLTMAHDKVAGLLFLPPPGSPTRPGVLLLGGSGGGYSLGW